MAKKKYLKFYFKCMAIGALPTAERDGVYDGLCGSLGVEATSLFKPTIEEKIEWCCAHPDYWGFDGERWIESAATSFGPTRQNIVLFMAAMNNEL